MARIKSVFGAYGEQLQIIIDNSLAKFDPVFFTKYFDWGIPRQQLTFSTAIGKKRIEAAASVVASGSPAPLRSRNNLAKLDGKVAAIKEKLVMDEDDYREFMALQSLNVDDATKRNAALDLLFGDVKLVGDSAMKRVDMMVLQALSSGVINMGVTNNPDGIATGDIDILFSKNNRFKVTEKWSVSASAKPITDIMNRVIEARKRGVTFATILMDYDTFYRMRAADETQSMLAGFFQLGTGQKKLGSLDQINEYLTSEKLPIIELIDVAIGVEKDGKISNHNPWTANAVSFIPAGKLGKIENALSIEEIKPVANISYAKFQRALISKWSTNDPFAEYTNVELLAFPAIQAIDSIFIMDTETKA